MDHLLNNGMLVVLDDEDADLLVPPRVNTHGRDPQGWFAWWNPQPHNAGRWMAVRHERRGPIRVWHFLHREVAFRQVAVSNIAIARVFALDGNYLNCRRENLRVYKKGGQSRGGHRPRPFEDASPLHGDEGGDRG